MEALLNSFSEVHRILFYVFIFLGMFIEGEMILILSGILVRSNNLNFVTTLFVAILAAFVHDLAFWLLGKKLRAMGRKKYLIFNMEKASAFLERMGRRDPWYIFVSKFAWNLNRLVLVGSGYIDLPMRSVAKYSGAAAIVWATTFLSLGYVFAHQADILKKDIRVALALFTLFLIMIIILENIFQRLFWKKNTNSGT